MRSDTIMKKRVICHLLFGKTAALVQIVTRNGAAYLIWELQILFQALLDVRAK
jgi:hypothetical protein